MQAKSVNVALNQAGVIVLMIKAGEASTPVPCCFEMDPATALVLAGQLEDCVHRILPPEPVCFRATGQAPTLGVKPNDENKA